MGGSYKVQYEATVKPGGDAAFNKRVAELTEHAKAAAAALKPGQHVAARSRGRDVTGDVETLAKHALETEIPAGSSVHVMVEGADASPKRTILAFDAVAEDLRNDDRSVVAGPKPDDDEEPEDDGEEVTSPRRKKS